MSSTKKSKDTTGEALPTLKAPPPNTPEKINWKKARVSFDRLLRVRGEDFKALSDTQTYKENGYDI